MENQPLHEAASEIRPAEALERIAAQIEARRRKLVFVRSPLFFGAGFIAAAVATADFIVRQTTGREYELLLALAGIVVAGICLGLYYRKHRTVTLNDRMLLNVWGYALGISGYTGAQLAVQEGIRFPLLGVLVIGMAIAAGVTGELFRRETTNKSQQSGSLVAIGWIALGGAFLAAWILRAALAEQLVLRFTLTLAAIALLLFGTGAVLRYNERRGRV